LVIGAHSELEDRRPGPFYNLSHIKTGADIIIVRSAQRYTYRVSAIWAVDPDDLSPVDLLWL
jgi:LPXTG-site transpeptidase (sortase) family protein